MKIEKIILDILNDYDIIHKDRINRKNPWGLCDLTKKKIYLKKNLPRYDKDITILHELLHVYFEKYRNEIKSEEEIDKMAIQLYRQMYDLET